MDAPKLRKTTKGINTALRKNDDDDLGKIDYSDRNSLEDLSSIASDNNSEQDSNISTDTISDSYSNGSRVLNLTPKGGTSGTNSDSPSAPKKSSSLPSLKKQKPVFTSEEKCGKTLSQVKKNVANAQEYNPKKKDTVNIKGIYNNRKKNITNGTMSKRSHSNDGGTFEKTPSRTPHKQMNFEIIYRKPPLKTSTYTHDNGQIPSLKKEEQQSPSVQTSFIEKSIINISGDKYAVLTKEITNPSNSTINSAKFSNISTDSKRSNKKNIPDGAFVKKVDLRALSHAYWNDPIDQVWTHDKYEERQSDDCPNSRKETFNITVGSHTARVTKVLNSTSYSKKHLGRLNNNSPNAEQRKFLNKQPPQHRKFNTKNNTVSSKPLNVVKKGDNEKVKPPAGDDGNNKGSTEIHHIDIGETKCNGTLLPTPESNIIISPSIDSHNKDTNLKNSHDTNTYTPKHNTQPTNVFSEPIQTPTNTDRHLPKGCLSKSDAASPSSTSGTITEKKEMKINDFMCIVNKIINIKKEEGIETSEIDTTNEAIDPSPVLAAQDVKKTIFSKKNNDIDAVADVSKDISTISISVPFKDSLPSPMSNPHREIPSFYNRKNSSPSSRRLSSGRRSSLNDQKAPQPHPQKKKLSAGTPSSKLYYDNDHNQAINSSLEISNKQYQYTHQQYYLPNQWKYQQFITPPNIATKFPSYTAENTTPQHPTPEYWAVSHHQAPPHVYYYHNADYHQVPSIDGYAGYTPVTATHAVTSSNPPNLSILCPQDQHVHPTPPGVISPHQTHLPDPFQTTPAPYHPPPLLYATHLHSPYTTLSEPTSLPPTHPPPQTNSVCDMPHLYIMPPTNAPQAPRKSYDRHYPPLALFTL